MVRGSLLSQCLGEFFGTLVLVFFGVGIVNAAVLAGVTQGLWQVAAVWGGGVALAIYATGAISGAHLNPAITVAMTVWRGFPARKVPAYSVSQLAGAFCGSLILYGMFHGLLAHFEAIHHILRGAGGSEVSAMVFGEYFPNPAMIGASGEAYRQVTMPTAMLAEGIGTAFLASFVFALTEQRNTTAARLPVPIFIGLCLAIIIMIVAPLTQAGLNPARDFGPRLVSYLLGWGRVAIPGPRGGFLTVYILSPLIGAVVGAGVYQALTRKLRQPEARLAEADYAPVVADMEPRDQEHIAAAERVSMSQVEPSVILVPCADCGRAGCRIARRAAELVVATTGEAVMRAAEQCPRGSKSFIVAVDASSLCQASAELQKLGVRAGAVVSAPEVLSRAGLVRPGVDVQARVEELAQALAGEIKASLESVLAEVRERRHYREEMAPVMERFRGIWSKVEAMAAPNGTPEAAERQRPELLSRRSRNLFAKLDEIVPPAQWSEPHDLFQDALLCLAYALEGWTAGEASRWEQNLEKARVQVKPLLRRLDS